MPENTSAIILGFWIVGYVGMMDRLYFESKVLGIPIPKILPVFVFFTWPVLLIYFFGKK